MPGNYRGIMMLEVAYKIVALVLHARLSLVCESADHLDHETQCGFRGKRGCADAIFTLKQLLRKRREHGQETWVLFIDLVKAFDRVPRKVLLGDDSGHEVGLLWRVLLKQGVPPKLVSLLRAMHNTVLVQFDVDGVTKTLDAVIGVKQGDLLGPILFTFFMAAVMETWRRQSTYELPTFRTARDFHMTGRRPRPRGAPKMTYGRSLGKALDQFSIDRTTWPELAADRSTWQETLRLGYPAIRRSKRIAGKPRVQLPAALLPRSRALASLSAANANTP